MASYEKSNCLAGLIGDGRVVLARVVAPEDLIKEMMAPENAEAFFGAARDQSAILVLSALPVELSRHLPKRSRFHQSADR